MRSTSCSSALRADERARVVPNIGFSARSAVEPSLERHPFGATSSSRTRVLAAHHGWRNSSVFRPGGGSAPCGMTLNSRPLCVSRNKHMNWKEYKKKNKAKVDSFICSLDESEKTKIANCWIAEISSEECSEGGSRYDKKLSWCIRDPDIGWEIILRVLSSTESKSCLLRLATWHLEDWLAIHGEAVIGRVETKASENLIFSRMLSCVYQNSMPLPVYKRVQAAAIYDDYFDNA